MAAWRADGTARRIWEDRGDALIPWFPLAGPAGERDHAPGADMNLDPRPEPLLEGRDRGRESRRASWKAVRARMEEEGSLRSQQGMRSRLTMTVKKKILRMFRLDSLAVGWTGLHERLVSRTLNIDFVPCEVFLPHLPSAFEGYRIIHLSDLHFDVLPGVEDVICDICERLESRSVDALVMTGDFADRQGTAPEGLLRPLRRVLSSTVPEDGVFAVLGNHDSWRYVDVLESLGIHVLVNESVRIRRGGQVMAFTGTDDPTYFFTETAVAALENSPDCFKIALVHSPELADIAARSGFSLYLAGHTHGGQMCLPNGKPVYIDLQRFKNFHHGHWSHGAMVGYTSAGAGASVLPYRLFRRGEVTYLTLRRAAGDPGWRYARGSGYSGRLKGRRGT